MLRRRGAYWCIGNPDGWFWFKRYRIGIMVMSIGPFWFDWFPGEVPKWRAFVVRR